jgi:integrase/recombinase XerD
MIEETQQNYVQIIKKLAAFLGRSPDTATFEDLRRFQLHVVASGVGAAAINRHVSALRFFFRVTLKRYAIVEHTHFIHEPRKLPVVLSQQEVARAGFQPPLCPSWVLAVSKLQHSPQT